MDGITHGELVFLNRLQREYTQDELPNSKQIRFDFGRLVGMVQRLDKEIEKMTKRQT